MVLVIVSEDGDDDYISLQDAVNFPENLIEVTGSWDADDEQAGSMAIPTATTVTITVTGSSKHSGVPHSGTGTWFRYRNIETGANMFDVVGNLTLVGGDYMSKLTGSSDECFRADICDSTVDLNLTDVLMGFTTRTSSFQDIFYLTDPGTVFEVNLTNCELYNGFRSGVHFDQFASDSFCNLNGCTTKGIGKSTLSTDRSGVVATDSTNTFTVSAFNSKFNMTTGNAFGAKFTGGTLVLARCITNKSGWEGDEGNFADTVFGSLVSRTWTENASPGEGDFVIVVEDDTSPYDQTLVDNYVDNDAQGLHSDKLGAGMTMPEFDVVGTTRTAPHSCGFFHVDAPDPGAYLKRPVNTLLRM